MHTSWHLTVIRSEKSCTKVFVILLYSLRLSVMLSVPIVTKTSLLLHNAIEWFNMILCLNEVLDEFMVCQWVIYDLVYLIFYLRTNTTPKTIITIKGNVWN